MMHIPTIGELAEMNELQFDRTLKRLEILADRGDESATSVIKQVDDIIQACGGTFEPYLLPACEYTTSHTREWCSNPTCRDS